MIKRSRTLWLIALLTALLVAAACGARTGTQSGPSYEGSGSSIGEQQPAPAPQPSDPLAEAREFFRGKTIEFIVPYGAGGGFDSFARLVAPGLEEILGATVVVLNTPGAGGLIGTNDLYNANADGLTVGIINLPGVIYNQILGEPNARYDLAQFSWIGRVSSDVKTIAVNKNTPYQTLGDFIQAGKPIRFGVTGKGSDDYYTITIESNALGFEVDMVTGYEGQSEATLAAVRGDVEAIQTPVNTMLSFVETGDLRLIATLGQEPDPFRPDTPLIIDQFSGSDQDRSLLEAAIGINELQRSIAAPPGVDPNRLEVLRQALMDTLNDPEIKSKAENSNLVIRPLPGEEVQTTVERVLSNSDELRVLLEEALSE